MTSHELARRLLAGPDLPVALMVSCDYDAVDGVTNLKVSSGTHTKDRVYVCRDGEWEDRLSPVPTHVFVEAKADQEFQAEVVEDDECFDDE